MGESDGRTDDSDDVPSCDGVKLQNLSALRESGFVDSAIWTRSGGLNEGWTERHRGSVSTGRLTLGKVTRGRACDRTGQLQVRSQVRHSAANRPLHCMNATKKEKGGRDGKILESRTNDKIDQFCGGGGCAGRHAQSILPAR